ncbi:MAG: hypothetical protein ABIH39_02755 [Candidatus Margulisiibacteriota bacterium]
MSSILKDKTSQNFVRVEFEKIYKVLADEIKDPGQRISLIETVNNAEDNIIDVRKRRRDEIRKRLNKIDKTYHDNFRKLQQELEDSVQDLREYLMVGLEN